jgi:hypothetical protein
LTQLPLLAVVPFPILSKVKKYDREFTNDKVTIMDIRDVVKQKYGKSDSRIFEGEARASVNPAIYAANK